MREHTRLGQRSAEWHAGGRQENRLLSGGDVIDARDWLARRPGKAAHPTELHIEFIRASESAQSARETAERQRLLEAAAANQEREQALATAERAQQQRERVAFSPGPETLTRKIAIACAFGTLSQANRSAARCSTRVT